MTALESSVNKTVPGLVADATGLCRNLRRPELIDRLHAASARIARPTTVVCVVGEYKHGKSHMINALLGEPVCPVDDDLATSAITLLVQHEEPIARVARMVNGEQVVEPIEIQQVGEFASERGNEANRRRVRLVEVGFPNPILERGICVVDTPGIGVLKGGYRSSVLSFIPYVDALIFATDASSEISPTEIEFLRDAERRCPTVLVALTKIDLYPEWRRILALDEAHLKQAGLPNRPIPVSSFLRDEALARDDAGLNNVSGFPELLTKIDQLVVHESRAKANARAVRDVADILALLDSALSVELRVLENSADGQRLTAEFEVAQQRLGELREVGSKWHLVLNDAFSDLRLEVDHRLRTRLRTVTQDVDQHLAGTDPRKEWATFVDGVQQTLATIVEEVFETIRMGTAKAHDRLAEALQEEIAQLPLPHSTEQVDITEIWSARERQVTAASPGLLSSGLSILRGSYSGVLMIGMLGGLAGLTVIGPITIGVGAIFGSKQLLDERRRATERRRHEARTLIRQYLDQVQAETANRAHQALQESQRSLRDLFGDLISNLGAEYAGTAQDLQRAMRIDQSEREERAALLRRKRALLGDLQARTAGFARQLQVAGEQRSETQTGDAGTQNAD